MHRKRKTAHLILILLAALMLSATVVTAAAEEKGAPSDQADGLQHRIDFGNAYILGQSIKSGAVYLLHRKQSEIESMLELRQDYRNEIKEDYAIDKTAIVSAEKEEQPQNETK